jgi:GNAT superfamily N-acetyltransferase
VVRPDIGAQRKPAKKWSETMMLGIRPARPDDLDALQALQWRSLRRGLGGAASATMEASLWRLFGLTPRHLSAGTCLVAHDAAGPLGFVAWQAEPLERVGLPREALAPLPAGCGRATALRALHVVPDATKRGIGSALLGEAEQRLGRAGFETAEVLELRRMVRALPDRGTLTAPAVAAAPDRAAAAPG